MKKMSTKKYLFALLAVILALSFAACGNQTTSSSTVASGSTTDSGSTTAADDSQSASLGMVGVSVDCLSLLDVDPDLAAKYSADGWILQTDYFEITSGMTAGDTLDAAGLDFDDAGGYVAEIEGLGSGVAGDMSGWLFFVNGEVPSVGAGQIELKDGDLVEWRYSCDGGADIGIVW